MSALWEEITVFVLSAAGFVACWCLLNRLLMAQPDSTTCSVVVGTGDGGRLEQTVRHLRWLKESGCGSGVVLIVDCGLNEEGRKIAALLTENRPDIMFCRLEEVSGFLRGMQ